MIQRFRILGFPTSNDSVRERRRYLCVLCKILPVEPKKNKIDTEKDRPIQCNSFDFIDLQLHYALLDSSRPDHAEARR